MITPYSGQEWGVENNPMGGREMGNTIKSNSKLSGSSQGKNPGITEGTTSKDVFRAFLAQRGFKLTRQREAVIDEIFNDSGHFEAEEIVQRLKGKKSKVSRATVYRTLELLRDSQLVEKLDIGESGALYEHVSAGEHHDHLICTQCKKVIEFHDPSLEKQQQAICNQYQFEETHHSLRIFGLCAQCRAKRRG